MLPSVALRMNPGEQVIFEGHPSWRSIIGFYIKGILVTAALALLVGLVTMVIDDEVDQGLVTIVAVVGRRDHRSSSGSSSGSRPIT